MDQRSRDQLAKNEALFRDVNERVKEVDRHHNIPTSERWDFLCECGNADCMDRVSLTVAEYEAVREHPAQFVIVPGHDKPEIEAVVHETEEYAVVEKHPGEDEIARASDPRS